VVRLALALAVMLGALVEIGQDDNGQPVVGGPGGVQGAKPRTAWDVPAFNQQPVPNPPKQQSKPPAQPSQPVP
jgi:hypothetical protein